MTIDEFLVAELPEGKSELVRETASSLEEKIRDYATAGTPLIWIADPMRRTIMTISSDAPVSWLAEGDMLEGGSVVPGFSCPVAEVFDGIARDA